MTKYNHFIVQLKAVPGQIALNSMEKRHVLKPSAVPAAAGSAKAERTRYLLHEPRSNRTGPCRATKRTEGLSSQGAAGSRQGVTGTNCTGRGFIFI